MSNFKEWYCGSKFYQRIICYLVFLGDKTVNEHCKIHDQGYTTHSKSKEILDYDLYRGIKLAGFKLLANCIYILLLQFGEVYYRKAYKG